MSDFRNKQWFKALTEEQKKAICEKFGCTMDSLKKAGHLVDDKLKIDLLRIEFPAPESWSKDFSIVESAEFKDLLSILASDEEVTSILETLEKMWTLWNPGIKFLKPDLKKSSVCLWIRDCKRWILENIESLEMNRDHEDQEVPKLCAYKVMSHLRVLFTSELRNVKESK
jgi:hypothetical protein